MGDLITLSGSVGRGGVNVTIDQWKVRTALLALGPSRGGCASSPPDLVSLGNAILNFQVQQVLPYQDGRIDKRGSSIDRMNLLLNGIAPAPGPGPGPAPFPTPGNSGQVRRLTIPGQPLEKTAGAWVPNEGPLRTEMPLQFISGGGSWTIQYFQLDADVVPNWFGVIIPNTVSTTDEVLLFFHPTPGQAGYRDETYKSKAGWVPLFHYMTDPMAACFTGAATGQILIMPLMTNYSAGNCGVLPSQWNSIIGQILGLIANPGAETATPIPPSSIVVASFSSGISYSHSFRAAAGLGSRLKGIIDFDGIISSSKASSAALAGITGTTVVRCYQTDATAAQLPILYAQDYIPLPRQRWTEPLSAGWPQYGATLKIHGAIPHSLMQYAARKAYGL